MDPNLQYYEQRERIERAAAKRATDGRSRRVHQELAEGYAALARNEMHLTGHSSDRGAPSHFTVIRSVIGR